MMCTIFLWICISIFSCDAEPLIHLKRFIGFKDEHYDEYSELKRFIHRGLYCSSCLGFWITLIGTFDIRIAIIVSVLTSIIKNKL